MKKYEAGFIGAGNMGGALAKAACRTVGPEKVAVTCRTEESTRRVAEKLGCDSRTTSEIIENSKYVFLGVKPQMLQELTEEIQGQVAKTDCILVSMLAGITIERLNEIFPGKKFFRIMPNTPCSVGSGMIFVCGNQKTDDKDMQDFFALMAKAGLVDELPENLIDAASAVAGCGPAFAYMFIQALADGGVECGLPRAKAAKYAAQMVLGSAEMVLASAEHPEKLKDDVCSPGGTTICGVHALERKGFRAACMDAVTAAYDKTKKLG